MQASEHRQLAVEHGTSSGRLDETQRLARWRIFILKAFLMIDVFEHQRKVLYLLGTDAYKRLYHGIQTQQEHGSQVAAAVTNIINGEAVGKPMKAGDGQVTVDPMMCSHPTSAMKRRGNKRNGGHARSARAVGNDTRSPK